MRILSGERLGARLKAARLAIDITQSQLAAHISERLRASGISREVGQSAVCAWELGHFSPEPEKWSAIAECLGLGVADLFFECQTEEVA